MTQFQSLKIKYLIMLMYIVPLLVGSYFLFAGGLSLEASRSSKALWDLGHVVYFMLLTFIALKQPLFKNMTMFKRSVVIIMASIVIGTLIEIAQYGTARNTDIFDVAHDVLGSLLILAFTKDNLLKASPQSVLLFKVFSALLLTVSLWPLSIALWDEQHARSQFPVLADFSSRLELKRWSGSAAFKYIDKTERLSGALHITFGVQRFSSLRLKYFEHDWSGFNKLRVKLFNPNKERVRLTLKIHDLKHKNNYLYRDRLNRPIHVKQGWNTFEVLLSEIKKAPKTRDMDLKNIVGLVFFTNHLSQARTLYLKSVELIP